MVEHVNIDVHAPSCSVDDGVREGAKEVLVVITQFAHFVKVTHIGGDVQVTVGRILGEVFEERINIGSHPFFDEGAIDGSEKGGRAGSMTLSIKKRRPPVMVMK